MGELASSAFRDNIVETLGQEVYVLVRSFVARTGLQTDATADFPSYYTQSAFNFFVKQLRFHPWILPYEFWRIEDRLIVQKMDLLLISGAFQGTETVKLDDALSTSMTPTVTRKYFTGLLFFTLYFKFTRRWPLPSRKQWLQSQHPLGRHDSSWYFQMLVRK